MRSVILYTAGGLVAVLLTALVAAGVAALVVGRAAPELLVPLRKPKESAPAALQEVTLPEFVTNLADAGAGRYIDISLVLLVDDDKAAAQVGRMQTHLRDAVLGVLRSRTSIEVAGEDGKESLAEDLRIRANEVLAAPLVRQVLITNLVVQ